MTGMSIKGHRQVQARIRGIRKRSETVSPTAWKSVGSYMSRSMRSQFTTEGKFLGTPWKPLKPEYKLWKVRNGYMRKILTMTGAMKQDFVGRPMDIEVYGKQSATFGSNDPKAVWHHYGTKRNGKRVNPPRPILKATPQMRADVANILSNYIIGKRGDVE